jgi:hypothetical protein
MIQHAFMITSAINTKFGVYTADQRLHQTIDTINSIVKYSPNSKIFLIEMAAIPLTEKQRELLSSMVDEIVDFEDDQDVKDIFNCSNSWDWVKNATEVMCFTQAIEKLKDSGFLEGVDRIHKISGRYTLTESFDPSVFDAHHDKIIVKHALNSQFPYQVTLVQKQYMSRLWSWPTALTDEVIQSYENGFTYIAERIAAGGYCDIEHMLYKFLPHEHIYEIARTGISGNLGPNGARIDD